MDLEAVAQLLQEAGWEVTPDDGELLASRYDQGGAWTLAMDSAGRLLFTATQPLQPARSTRIRQAGLAYRAAWEEQGVFTLATEVHSVEELQQVLDHLPALVRRARATHGRAVSDQ